MKYSVAQLKAILNADLIGNEANLTAIVQDIKIDSRKVKEGENNVFWALKGEKNDGHKYINDVYLAGINIFVIDNEQFINEDFEEATFLLVENTLDALQHLAIHHRNIYNIPTIGITGSNGKTIVKEWLYQLIGPDIKVVKSPKSYNSQIGVPLSVLNIEAEHELGIFEAGISQKDEMEKIAPIIDPAIVILTNIGPAHDAGFADRQEKLNEKLKLAKNAATIIYSMDQPLVHETLANAENCVRWGRSEEADIPVKIQKKGSHTIITFNFNEEKHDFHVPFTDKASIENVCHCITTLLILDYDIPSIQRRVIELKNVPMRMELKYGANSCTIIDDTYSADLESLKIALQFLDEQPSIKDRTLVLSEFMQTGIEQEEFIKQIITLAQTYGIKKLVGVGGVFKTNHDRFKTHGFLFNAYSSTDDLLENMAYDAFNNEIILIKGARVFEFERLVQKLELQSHRTVLEINLNHLVNNLKLYKKFVKDETGIVAMVKAFSYGAGSVEIASVLEKQGVVTLAVAYPDEGVKLRSAGIRCPIMVMNAGYDDLSILLDYHLEPEVYSIEQLEEIIGRIKTKGIDENKELGIHLKIDTGMHRLGVMPYEIDKAIELIKSIKGIKVISVFSHLAAVEDPIHDTYTFDQLQLFKKSSGSVLEAFEYDIKRHILNSAGIVRFTGSQYDWVRLGIGMYGVDTTSSIQDRLIPVGTLKTKIAQIKKVKKGETVGYGRKGELLNDTTLAILPIGYADGLDRRLSNGKGSVFIKGKQARIIGNICMDLTMVDVTYIDNPRAGDEVEIFGKNISLVDAAARIGTIPYELLTNISERVKRVYIKD
ncbi:MAG: bifunctional UDP-N-acetylmuramoyl-tripeptide:D-alanyl-D-alanine ligase/alanine racemase [Bacteroidetes bacterium]|nr:bifunctional UDP-N-acetylmuramoyl-tripeptide:D-alanyl-D-alanine ligase/alanine racemase [Bacteroidota bacterium]